MGSWLCFFQGEPPASFSLWLSLLGGDSVLLVWEWGECKGISEFHLAPEGC